MNTLVLIISAFWLTVFQCLYKMSRSVLAVLCLIAFAALASAGECYVYVARIIVSISMILPFKLVSLHVGWSPAFVGWSPATCDSCHL